jgi:hypothetical protein
LAEGGAGHVRAPFRGACDRSARRRLVMSVWTASISSRIWSRSLISSPSVTSVRRSIRSERVMETTRFPAETSRIACSTVVRSAAVNATGEDYREGTKRGQ